MIKAPMHIDAIILAFYMTRNMKLYGIGHGLTWNSGFRFIEESSLMYRRDHDIFRRDLRLPCHDILDLRPVGVCEFFRLDDHIRRVRVKAYHCLRESF